MLDWNEVIGILDENFHFRSGATHRQDQRAYRLGPNTDELILLRTQEGLQLVFPLDKAPAGIQGGVPVSIPDRDTLMDWIASFKGSPSVRPPNHSFAHPEGVRAPVSTNLILYGPPGTGKTYATAEAAVALCDGSAPDERPAVMARYEELRAANRITFVTFHQSYGYEEFVEGLRPVSTLDNQVSYPIVPGVFLKACKAAGGPRILQREALRESSRQKTWFKMSLGATWNGEAERVFRYCLENDCVLLGWGSDLDFSACTTEASIAAQIAEQGGGLDKLSSHAWFLNYFKHELKIGDAVIVSQGNKRFRAIGEIVGDYEYVEDAPFHQSRAVRWLAVFDEPRPVEELYEKEFSMASLYKLRPDQLRFEALDALLLSGQQDEPPQPHVLIIDEINRANISKVFGELITLIEPDKRHGAANAITVRLPYSGEEFSVPANLHLIGTMNTADRSIALLDTALRRRFQFRELPPDPGVLGTTEEGINLAALLTALNERIEFLHDRDHTIGHAYLIGIKTLTDLQQAFRHRILPLLQEYFYDDWSRIRMVLADHQGRFIEEIRDVPRGLEDFADSLPNRPRYRVRDTAFTLEAFQAIYA